AGLRPVRRTAPGGAGPGRPAQRRGHAVGPRTRLARRLRRPGPPGPLRPRPPRRGLGVGVGRAGTGWARAGWALAGRERTRRAAGRDTWGFAREVAARELVSVVDNPVVLPDGRVESTGNFHGAPLGFAADFLAIAAAEVGAIAERRVDRLLDVCRSRNLPAFLTPDPGVNSGLMIAQYTAAGIVAENRRLA